MITSAEYYANQTAGIVDIILGFAIVLLR